MNRYPRRGYNRHKPIEADFLAAEVAASMLKTIATAFEQASEAERGELIIKYAPLIPLLQRITRMAGGNDGIETK